MARTEGRQDARPGDAPPADLHLQRGRGLGRRPCPQCGVLHELPSNSRHARWKAEGVPEPKRRSHPDARPRRRWRAGRVPSVRRESRAVLWGVREGLSAKEPVGRGADTLTDATFDVTVLAARRLYLCDGPSSKPLGAASFW